MNKNKNLEDDFILRSEEVQDVLGNVPIWMVRWGISLIAIIFIILLVGSAFFKYPDIISSNMVLTGKNPPAKLVGKISGKLIELNVKNNQYVKAGDYLGVIENASKTSDVVYIKEYLETFSTNIENCDELPQKNLMLGNLQDSYSQFYTALFNYIEFKRLNYLNKKIEIINKRIQDYQCIKNDVKNQKSIVEKQCIIVREKYRRDSILNTKKVISEESLGDTYNLYLQSSISISNMQTTLKNMSITISELEENIFSIRQQYIENKNSYENQLKSSFKQLQSDIQVWELNFAFIAPFDGKITFTNYWVKNQNITAGEEIFTVLPTDGMQMIGKALLPIIRSGKVKSGQNVNISFNNYPENEYGIVKGYVKNISSVPSNGNYILDIELKDGLLTNFGKKLPVSFEMTATADIITNDLSVLERIFSPLRKILKKGFE
jgi:HlyD family secretion protein